MPDLSPESAEAVHKVKNAAQAVEMARDAQMHSAIEASAETTRAALADALRDVFGENQDAGRFIDVTRIPLICAAIVNMHGDIAAIKGNITWGVRIVIGAVILGILKLVIMG
jgi:hypothetical protein